MVKVIVIILSVYGLIIILAYLTQDKFIFHPEKLPSNFRFVFQRHFHEIKLKIDENHLVDGLLFKSDGQKGVVFYFKGNTRSIKGWSKFTNDFLNKGYDVFIIDYPGFGKSLGKKTIDEICNGAIHAYHWLSNHYPENKIIIYGRSFGAGIAAFIAGKFNPSLLVLESPYYSFQRLVQYYTKILPVKWFLRHRIPLNQYLRNVQCPIFIIHGTKDWVIPFRHSVKLLKEYPGKISLYPVKGAKHNNLSSFNFYHQALNEIFSNY